MSKIFPKQINPGTDGYILSTSGSSVVWAPPSISSFTGNTSGDCITDLWVSNIYSCSPLNINPNDEGKVHFGSTSGITFDLNGAANTSIGLGTTTPGAMLDIKDFNSGGIIFRAQNSGSGNLQLNSSSFLLQSSGSFQSAGGGKGFVFPSEAGVHSNGQYHLTLVSRILGTTSGNLAENSVFQSTQQGRVGIGYQPLSSWDGTITEMPATVTVKGEPTTASTTDMIFMVTKNDETETFKIDTAGNTGVGNISTLAARLHVKGVGSTSATNALLIENSSNTDKLIINDAGQIGSYPGGNATISSSFGEYRQSAGYNFGFGFYPNATSQGVTIQGRGNTPTLFGVAHQGNPTGTVYGISVGMGPTNASTVYSIYGAAANTQTNAYGVYGRVANTSQIPSNDSVGVYGVNQFVLEHDGHGGYFRSFPNTTTVEASNIKSYGVRAYAGGLHLGNNAGSTNNTSYGVYSLANGSDNTYGVYSLAQTTTNQSGGTLTGGYFESIDGAANTANNTLYAIIAPASDNTSGFGTATPTATLHVDGSFRYVDGNETAGYVLTSDANGNATWMSGATGGGISKYAADVPMTGGTAVTVTHSLGSTDVTVQVKNPSGELITAGTIDNYLSNSVDIEVSITGTYRVIIIG